MRLSSFVFTPNMNIMSKKFLNTARVLIKMLIAILVIFSFFYKWHYEMMLSQHIKIVLNNAFNRKISQNGIIGQRIIFFIKKFLQVNNTSNYLFCYSRSIYKNQYIYSKIVNFIFCEKIPTD